MLTSYFCTRFVQTHFLIYWGICVHQRWVKTQSDSSSHHKCRPVQIQVHKQAFPHLKLNNKLFRTFFTTMWMFFVLSLRRAENFFLKVFCVKHNVQDVHWFWNLICTWTSVGSMDFVSSYKLLQLKMFIQSVDCFGLAKCATLILCTRILFLYWLWSNHEPSAKYLLTAFVFPFLLQAFSLQWNKKVRTTSPSCSRHSFLYPGYWPVLPQVKLLHRTGRLNYRWHTHINKQHITMECRRKHVATRVSFVTFGVVSSLIYILLVKPSPHVLIMQPHSKTIYLN